MFQKTQHRQVAATALAERGTQLHNLASAGKQAYAKCNLDLPPLLQMQHPLALAATAVNQQQTQGARQTAKQTHFSRYSSRLPKVAAATGSPISASTKKQARPYCHMKVKPTLMVSTVQARPDMMLQKQSTPAAERKGVVCKEAVRVSGEGCACPAAHSAAQVAHSCSRE